MKQFVNVVVVSDHGMTYGHHSPYEVDREIRKVKLSNHLVEGTYRWIVGSGSHAGVYPKSRDQRKALVERLQGIAGVRVYGKHDIPEELHYKHNKNSPPILVLAEPGTIILSSKRGVQRPAQRTSKAHGYSSPQSLIEQTKMGLSGYDPKEPDMRGIFLAKGPDFKSTGDVYHAIKLVDVYQVLTHVLGFPAQANNGTWEDVRDLLIDPNAAPNRTFGVFQTVIFGLLASIFTHHQHQSC
jgi:ectonucleotide pyrophosphatase/phosphodiesterase family protein 6